MKRITESPLSYKITFIPVISLGAGFVMLTVFGALLINVMVMAHLHCERLEPEQIRCERATAFLGIRALQQVEPIDGSLSEATISTRTGSKGKKSYYVVLHNQEGSTVTFTQSRSDYTEASRIKDEINGFLQYEVDQRQLDVEEHVSWLFVAFIAFLLSVPVLIVFISSIDTVEIKPAQQKISITRRQLWRTLHDEIPMSNLVRVRVEERRGSKGSKSYCLWLHTKEGAAISLGQEESRGTLTALMERLEKYILTN